MFNFWFICFSLEYHKEIISFNEQPIYATLAEHMFCDKEKLVKQINQLVDFEEEKITEPIDRYLFRIFECL